MTFMPRPARCRNCGKRFTKLRPNHKSCSAQCRFEFNRNGQVPATRIAKTVERIVKQQLSDLRERLARLEGIVEPKAKSGWVRPPTERQPYYRD